MLTENTPLLETERLILRKFTQDDISDVLLIFGDEEVNTFLPWFRVKSIVEAQEFLEKNILSEYSNDTAYYYAVALKTDNRPIGYVHLGGIGKSNDLGYGLRKEFWHKGIITEASMALVNRLKELGYPYITATHDVKNPNSGEVMKKLGMTYRYSYEEVVQPKNYPVIFRMYQLNLSGVEEPTYQEYWLKYENHFIE